MKFVAALILLVLFLPALAFAAPGEQQPEAWTSVQSKNFELIGNATEPQVRRVAAELERFRETMRGIFPGLKFDSAVPTRVVVFKDAASHQPFKPRRANGEADAQVLGTFQAGTDVNYITVSIAQSEENFTTIFHEYVHFIIANNFPGASVPPWFNEGLAEYYETFRLDAERGAILGEAPAENLRLLQQRELLPLAELLAIDAYSLRNEGSHGKSIFYAESWALVHYLKHNGRDGEFERFFDLLFAGKPVNEAFATAFKTNAAAIERELRDYVKARRLQTASVAVDYDSISDAQIKSTRLSEAAAQAVLGDLLLHSDRVEEAVRRLKQAVALDDNQPLAHASLGLALVKERDFGGARKHLEKAVRLNVSNYLPHYVYALALSREDADLAGYSSGYAPNKTREMRDALRKSIELKPDFAPSYHLLAVINLVNRGNLNEAVELLEKAQSLDPGNLRFELDLAQIRLQQTEYEQAERIAERVFRHAEDRDLRRAAQAVLISARDIQESLKRIKELEDAGNRRESEFPVISQEEGFLRAINESLRRPAPGEKRILGYLAEIECSAQANVFVVRPQNSSPNEISGEALKLRSAEMQKVKMIAFAPGIEGTQMGCGARREKTLSVITYRPDASGKSDGEIVAVEFVPDNFEFRF